MTAAAPRGGGAIGVLVARLGGRRRARLLARHHARTGAQARTAVAERIRAGEQVGALPYGYRSCNGPRRGLGVDESTAPVVVQIFTWRVTDRIGATVIARRLDADPDRYPPPRDTSGARRRWTRGIVRHILANPVYTGRRVWGRTHQGRPAPAHRWATSAHDAYPALIDDLTFHAAQRPLGPPRSKHG